MGQKDIEKLNKEILNNIVECHKNEFIEFYKTHNQKETLDKFGIRNKKQLRRILEVVGYDFSYVKSFKGKPSGRSHESYLNSGVKSSQTQKENWENKTKEEKEDWSIKCRNVFNNLSEDVKQNKIEKFKNTVSNKDKELILKENQKRSESCKRYWEKLRPKERQDIITEKNNKVKETCIEKYGVSYPCVLDSARMNGNNSEPNKRFSDLLDKVGIEYTREFSLGDYSYDFKIDNTLVEINPTYTHNSTKGIFDRNPLDKNYHYNKTKYAKDRGFRCINVWDWDDIYKVVMLFIKRDVIFARKCSIKEVPLEEATTFINEYHLQNYAKDKIRIGLYYNNSLVSIMTFDKPRYNNKYDYELVRYCSSYNVTGGAEKLFKYFIDKYKPKSVISYCDLSKFIGETYKKLGFTYEGYAVSKHWYDGKRHITDNLLRQRGFDQLFGVESEKGISNKELMINAGFVEIYDCGQARYTISL